MSFYADTSIYVALYLPDRHSVDVQDLIAEFRPHFLLTPLHRAEWSHAVFQKISEGKLSAPEARQIIAHFERDRERGRWCEVAQPISAVERSMEVAREHGVRLGAATSETLHVAAALELRAAQFWTLSPSASALARAVNLVVLSPAAGPQPRRRTKPERPKPIQPNGAQGL